MFYIPPWWFAVSPHYTGNISGMHWFHEMAPMASRNCDFMQGPVGLETTPGRG
ncbi:hypothetical protein GXY_00379 [Novacetimonas hansenii ATCC 23769]|uniref:Uncharacterized protein n=1 Tax=Novacetimonas hansenii ATCC 23769 TaxID=714995 RepID=D5QAE1_NOVHA|nr:hypothetical protein GXY_00379 [Novacetimonas hansenii ATCC 23769]